MQPIPSYFDGRFFSLAQFKLSHKRFLLPVLLFALLTIDELRPLVVSTLADAFWAVTCYVAFTLAIYHYLSRFFNQQNRLTQCYQQSRHGQVVFAALMGALPGCGGAIIVTTQFIQGKVGFSAMVAVLTATMGDAAFLLLASEPKTGLAMVGLGIVVGAVSGMLVNVIHADDFMRPNTDHQIVSPNTCITPATSAVADRAINLQGWFWQLIIIPTTLVAILGSFQIDLNKWLSLPDLSMEWLGAILAITTMSLWALTKEINDYQSTVSEDDKLTCSHPMQKVAQDTHFVSAWVIIAFLSFELITHFAHLDLATLVSGWGAWMPMMGLAVGLLPGCGPQILITSLYIGGIVPLSSQIANALSNDGDALFPALAMAPKAALAATFYSAIPAFIVGYGYYFLFE